jgi:hypothetical protein
MILQAKALHAASAAISPAVVAIVSSQHAPRGI